jgi:hypothetical protein
MVKKKLALKKGANIRLNQVISYIRLNKLNGLDNKTFANLMKYHPAALSGIIGGSKPINQLFLDKLAIKFPETNIDYIISGEGEMFLTAKKEAI